MLKLNLDRRPFNRIAFGRNARALGGWSRRIWFLENHLIQSATSVSIERLRAAVWASLIVATGWRTFSVIHNRDVARDTSVGYRIVEV